MEVLFTEHANEKIAMLGAHGVKVTRKAVGQAVTDPERVLTALGGRQIAERSLDREHVLRVVFVDEGRQIRVITLYPARKGRY